ncbi:MAG: RDD family protein [Hymenobacteraceae bacterium]|nr:RDD family protein [Hymenobacteraceae bacterium]
MNTSSPEAEPLDLPYAGFWIRFVALFLDSLILSVVSVVLFFLLGIPLVPELDDYATRLKINLLSMFLGWVYYAGLESSRYQATLGKQMMGIFVTDTDGERISFARATGRYFGKLLSGMILLIGYIMAAFTERKQALHDLIAKTLVFKHR